MSGARAVEIRSRQVDGLRDHLGPLINGLLAEDDTTDVILNPPLKGEVDGRIWLTRIGHDRAPVGFMTAENAVRLIGAVASTMNKAVTGEAPRVEGHLITDGSRFLGVIEPVGNGGPFFCIRKHSTRTFTLADYVANGQMTERQRQLIEQRVIRRDNFIISGGTGSGKTTLLNAIIRSMVDLTPHHRFFGIEQSPELQCSAPDQTFTLTTANVSIEDLVVTALRAFPDRILIGEARGGEMLSILQAWGTGHDGGAATIHSNIHTPAAALERIEDMVSMAKTPPAFPQRMIARTIGLIICLELTADKQRRIRQIVSVQGYDPASQSYIVSQED
jgi:type IV secretion system protein VirB11